MTSNLRSARSRLRRNCASVDAFEIAKRLVEVDAEAAVGGHARSSAGDAVEIDQVVLEHLDGVEARGRDRVELVGEGAAQRNGRDALAHGVCHRCRRPGLRLDEMEFPRPISGRR